MYIRPRASHGKQQASLSPLCLPVEHSETSGPSFQVSCRVCPPSRVASTLLASPLSVSDYLHCSGLVPEQQEHHLRVPSPCCTVQWVHLRVSGVFASALYSRSSTNFEWPSLATKNDAVWGPKKMMHSAHICLLP